MIPPSIIVTIAYVIPPIRRRRIEVLERRFKSAKIECDLLDNEPAAVDDACIAEAVLDAALNFRLWW